MSLATLAVSLATTDNVSGHPWQSLWPQLAIVLATPGRISGQVWQCLWPTLSVSMATPRQTFFLLLVVSLATPGQAYGSLWQCGSSPPGQASPGQPWPPASEGGPPATARDQQWLSQPSNPPSNLPSNPPSKFSSNVPSPNSSIKQPCLLTQGGSQEEGELILEAISRCLFLPTFVDPCTVYILQSRSHSLNPTPNIPSVCVARLKGIVHYFTMYILKEQGVYGHHNGVNLSV